MCKLAYVPRRPTQLFSVLLHSPSLRPTYLWVFSLLCNIYQFFILNMIFNPLSSSALPFWYFDLVSLIVSSLDMSCGYLIINIFRSVLTWKCQLSYYPLREPTIHQSFNLFSPFFLFNCVIWNQRTLTCQSWHLVLIVIELFLAYLTSLWPRFMYEIISSQNTARLKKYAPYLTAP